MASHRGGPTSGTAAVRAVAVVLLTLVLAACGSAGGGGTYGGDGGGTPTPGSGSTPTAGPSPSLTMTPVAPDTPAQPGPPAPDEPPSGQGGEVLAWLPIGPAAPSDPAWEFMYGLASRAQCDALSANAENEPSGSIWHAAATLCVAMTNGDETAWRTGADQLEQAAPVPDHCLMRALRAALGRLVQYHAAHPEAPIVTRSTPGGTACTIGLTGIVEGNQPDADPDASTDLCGGREFRLIGRLVDVTHVTVSGARVDVRREAENVYVFTAPAGPAGVATVIAHGPGGAIPGSARLSYVDSGFPCSPPPTNDGGTGSTPPPGTPTPGGSGTPAPGTGEGGTPAPGAGQNGVVVGGDGTDAP